MIYSWGFTTFVLAFILVAQYELLLADAAPVAQPVQAAPRGLLGLGGHNIESGILNPFSGPPPDFSSWFEHFSSGTADGTDWNLLGVVLRGLLRIIQPLSKSTGCFITANTILYICLPDEYGVLQLDRRDKEFDPTFEDFIGLPTTRQVVSFTPD
ncbi:hypothetical protein BC629DRAFT_1031055 [Irpex lacteus]|nr:hypothetical protein BC629DRAFT_1031055 [Irpex lacteus]